MHKRRHGLGMAECVMDASGFPCCSIHRSAVQKTVMSALLQQFQIFLHSGGKHRVMAAQGRKARKASI